MAINDGANDPEPGTFHEDVPQAEPATFHEDPPKD